MTTFNEAIRERRTLLGLSLSELARRAGVSKAYLHRLERPGSSIQPSVDVARRVADALGLDVADVLTTSPVVRSLPHGLRAYLDAASVGDRQAAALEALAPFVPEDVPADEWRFALEALERSLLRDSPPSREKGGR